MRSWLSALVVAPGIVIQIRSCAPAHPDPFPAVSGPIVRRAMGQQRSGPSRGARLRRGWRAALPWGLLAVALLSLLPGFLLAGSTTPAGTDQVAVSSYSLVNGLPSTGPTSIRWIAAPIRPSTGPTPTGSAV